MKNIDYKTVVVLGMHRSGTSMIASILNKLGVSMGKVMLGKTPSNPLGHFEDKDFYNLNRKILKLQEEIGGTLQKKRIFWPKKINLTKK